VIGSDSRPALPRSSAAAVSTALAALAYPNWPMKNSGCVRGVVGIAANLEVDEGRVPVLGGLAGADVLDGFEA
jgi:hypothetical protein